MRTENPIFVVFEGGEGCGKSTQVDYLVRYLEKLGRDVVATREPGGTPVGEALRAIVLDKSYSPAPLTEALIYAADRAEHVEQIIIPALAKGQDVVSDRFYWSSLVYQGVGRDLGLDVVSAINGDGLGSLEPSVVIILDLSPEVGLARIRQRADRIEAESIEFHKNIREAFLDMAVGNPKAAVVDGSPSPDEIAGEVEQIVNGLL